MPSKYWIKLYHEILDDPKMGRLPDRLWRRTIEIFLLAGETDKEGVLPSVADMAWKLRIPEAELEADLMELAAEGIEIVTPHEGRWFVTKFAARQAPVSSKERVKRFRERQRKEQYHSNGEETQEKPNGNASVTKRYTDTDTESTPTGSNDPSPKKKSPPPTTNQAASRAFFGKLAEVCNIDWRVCGEDQKGALNQTSGKLRKAGATLDDLESFREWWDQFDWRGKQGDDPEPHQVREQWGRAMAWRNGQDGKGEKDLQPVTPTFMES